MPKLTIDGRSVDVKDGSTILDACNRLGIVIPTLCYMKDLTPEGSCRMCMVEVEGARSLVASCSTPATEGMVVKTKTDAVVESRRFVLDMLLSNHNTDCFNCAKNGECKLQDYCYEYGVEKPEFEGKRCDLEVDDSSPFFEYDPTKCILCRKCVRTCQELQCNGTLTAAGRGFDTNVATPMEGLIRGSNCVSCGNCVQACPVGALTMKDAKKYRSWETKEVLTTCPHCGTGCQMKLIIKNNKVVGAKGSNGPSNSGLLCVKGRFGSYEFVHSGDRITDPLIKKNGKFEKASWEEALDLVASKFNEIKKKYGSESLAGFSCSRAPNEDNYMMQKLVRAVFGTNNVDNCARVCHSASVHGLAITLGSGAMTNTVKDITAEPDVILIIGSNPTEAHPVLGAQLRRAARRGAKLIVVDPRNIKLTEDAHLHLKIRPGTNVAFANGLMHIILKEGLADQEFIKNRTEGFDDLAKIVEEWTPEKTAKVCNISPEDLREAAILYAKADKAPIIYCLGVTEHSTGTEGVMSMSNIAMMVGKVGRPGCGVNPIRGQNNVQGACDMGALPEKMPGYQNVTDDKVMEKFEKHWGVPLNRKPGLKATEVLPAAITGDIKGLYIFGEDPMVTDPDTAHVKKALENLEFFVLQELFMTETAQFADVILPGTSYAEKEGTFTNTERRVQRVRKAVTLQGNMRLDTDIIIDVMNKMGYDQPHLTSAQIMDEIAELTPSFGGISHARLDSGETLQWPCLDCNHPGTKIMHVDKCARGLGYFYPAVYKESQELPDDDYPVMMVTGRMLYHYNTRSMTGRSKGITEIVNESYIEMHYDEADKIGIKNGDKVKVSSRRGEITTTARVGKKVSSGEAFMTFHFPDGNANTLTNAVYDDIACIPEYKVCAIKIEKA